MKQFNKIHIIIMNLQNITLGHKKIFSPIKQPVINTKQHNKS